MRSEYFWRVLKLMHCKQALSSVVQHINKYFEKVIININIFDNSIPTRILKTILQMTKDITEGLAYVHSIKN